MLFIASTLVNCSSFGSTLGSTSLDEGLEFSAEDVDGDVFFEAGEKKSPFFGEPGEGGINEGNERGRLVRDASAPSCKSTVG